MCQRGEPGPLAAVEAGRRLAGLPLRKHRKRNLPTLGFCTRCSKTQWLRRVPPVLAFKYSTSRPHRSCMCFVRISEHTALAGYFFITDMECVYCAVRTASLAVSEANFSFCQVQNSGWCSAPSLCCLLKHSTYHYATFYTSQHFTCL